MIPTNILFHDKFLLTPIGDRLGLTTNWVINDSEQAFLFRKSTMPSDWSFNDLKIQYNFNQNGYRAPEWSDVDWSKSIIVFGCSLTMGVGLPYEWTWAQKLSRKLNVPVINLGVSGGSNVLSLYNSYRLVSKGIRPLAVINMLTSTDRATFFLDNDNGDTDLIMQHLGPWALAPVWIDKKIHSTQTIESRKTALAWYQSHLRHRNNIEIYGQMFAESMHNFWLSKNIPVITRATEFSRNVNFPALSIMVDNGRDPNNHPGPETTTRWADELEPDVVNLLRNTQ